MNCLYNNPFLAQIKLFTQCGVFLAIPGETSGYRTNLRPRQD
jgi:hypothetical protein